MTTNTRYPQRFGDGEIRPDLGNLESRRLERGKVLRLELFPVVDLTVGPFWLEIPLEPLAHI